MTNPNRPSAVILYHFFYPDDVVSAQHVAQLSQGLCERGWNVTALPSNRSCHNNKGKFLPTESWNGVNIERIWRPRLKNSSGIGRALNALWLVSIWSLQAMYRRPDLLVVGSDPIFSVLVTIPWRIFSPKTKIFHWCLDLHPEAAVAETLVSENHWLIRALKPLLRRAYRNCDLIGTMGPCMDSRINMYTARGVPIMHVTPWALSERTSPLQIDAEERALAFGNATLGLMYSGNFGRAHDAEIFINLARKLRSESNIRFAFSVRGHGVEKLRRMVVPEDENITFLDFAPEYRMEQRISAANIHLVSVRDGFHGIVAPSKFQGAIGIGRPILFSGDSGSAVATWVREHSLGWIVDNDNIETVAARLKSLANSPDELETLNKHCCRTYTAHFSKKIVIDRLHSALSAMVHSAEGGKKL